jgi:hypothetical protein
MLSVESGAAFALSTNEIKRSLISLRRSVPPDAATLPPSCRSMPIYDEKCR